MVKLNKTTKGVEAIVLAKLEFLNPSGSIKDRIARHMIESARKIARRLAREGILAGISSGANVSAARGCWKCR